MRSRYVFCQCVCGCVALTGPDTAGVVHFAKLLEELPEHQLGSGVGLFMLGQPQLLASTGCSWLVSQQQQRLVSVVRDLDSLAAAASDASTCAFSAHRFWWQLCSAVLPGRLLCSAGWQLMALAVRDADATAAAHLFAVVFDAY
jgi:hypothetical protein